MLGSETTYRFKELRDNISFFNHIMKIFNLGLSWRERVDMQTMIREKIEMGEDDLSIMKFIAGGHQSEFMTESSSKKVDELKDKRRRMTFSHTDLKLLDIGSERADVLDMMEEVVGKGNVSGLNIATGFCHYDENVFKDKRIKLYDGVHIQAENVYNGQIFDIITMFSVLHHVNPDFMDDLADEIRQSCNGYLFIKENDLATEREKAGFYIQHLAWNKGNEMSYMNIHTRADAIVNLFTKHGFELLYLKRDIGEWSFNGVFYALFKVKDEHIDRKQMLRDKIKEKYPDISGESLNVLVKCAMNRIEKNVFYTEEIERIILDL